MFDKIDIRYKLMAAWILAFASLWIMFHNILPLNIMSYQLNKIEENIKNEDWKEANKYTFQFKNTFSKKRFLIQMNNSTEALTTFEHTIGQLETTVKYNQESALEYIGALKESLNLVIKPFSGP
ncbi:DUF4363 family protein [Clostridium magnum]|uniref:DUF4363 family protein n=1 Tax=Clostridium magnum DSM 2767 TaxID=1121326 RepID=A0A162SXD7_9CLOT|nr:DUF4363 family protein [Clostridium magnum]KZL91990.1 hypothetical protein CLMAG_17960 [Clostridium magnum DSM 2767]SHH26929.1 protein of unknown function [Clostridium magnum DSM 2767]